MPGSNFHLRGISPKVMVLLKQEAKRLRTSVNGLVLQLIEQGLKLPQTKPTYHDLDTLAGSWSAVEEKVFKESTQLFQQVDWQNNSF